jgi:hypothetical protein
MDFEKSLLHQVENGSVSAGDALKEASSAMAEYGGTPSPEFVEALASLGLIDKSMSDENIEVAPPIEAPENIEVIAEEAVPAIEEVDMTLPAVEAVEVLEKIAPEEIAAPIEEMGEAIAPEEVA